MKGDSIVKKPIPNSPGYFVTTNGEIFNSNNVRLKTFYKKDGYERISLPSLRHGKRINHSVHLIVAEVFLNGGKYTGQQLQVNHIDGNKKNNKLSNLEIITGTENVNKAHNMGLYTYDLPVSVTDIYTGKIVVYRSLREVARFFNVFVNYIKPRIVISAQFPLFNKFRLDINFKHYIKHVSSLDNTKTIYVYSHIVNQKAILTSYSQLAILFGLPYITIGKKLNRGNYPIYVGGYSISLNDLKDLTIRKTKQEAIRDRDKIWKKMATNKQ